MIPQKFPRCSIIVLNYYGKKIIANTLNSVLKLNYPKDRYEIIVVDNNSKDNSRQILESFADRHSNIRLIFLDKNLGFAGGNNVGIRQAKGEYIALLNNDCIVDKNWLMELIEVARTDKKIFAVNSKILLYPKYLDLRLEIDQSLVPLFSWLSKSNLYNFNKKKIYINISKRENNYQLEVPFDPVNDSEIEISFLFNSKNINNASIRNLIHFSNIPAGMIYSKSNKIETEVRIKINLKNFELRKATLDKVQNAGIIIFHDGYARDIGALIRYGNQYYEYDKGQFDKRLEVYAACAAAVLLNKKILDKIGYLDESFFMYYEDVEISERARLAGFKIYYSPKAIVRHIHAMSSGENSDFFTYHAEKGRLLHVFYNFPPRIFIREYIKLILKIIYTLLNMVIKIKNLGAAMRESNKDQKSVKRSLLITKILIYFLTHLIYLLYKRMLKRMKIKFDVVDKNYQQILKGGWYEN